MHAKESPILEAYHMRAGLALRVIRETFPGTKATSPRLSTDEFRRWIGDVLGMASPPSRPYWNNLETGYREISAGAFHALVDAVGMELEEVLSMALHEMVHGQAPLIRAYRDQGHQRQALLIRTHKDQGRQRLIADLGRWDRVMTMARQLVELDAATRPQDEESRSADATEHPPSESP